MNVTLIQISAKQVQQYLALFVTQIEMAYEIPSPTRMFRRKKTKEHTEEFIGNSTLHGFHYCFDKRYRFRRILWIIIVMGSIGMLMQKLFEAGQKFFDRPFTSTSTVINPDDMKFPAVSLCNINDFRVSKLKGTTFLEIMRGRLNYSALTGPQYANASKRANHQMKDMLEECQVNFMTVNRVPITCSPKNFSIFYQSQGKKPTLLNSIVQYRGPRSTATHAPLCNILSTSNLVRNSINNDAFVVVIKQRKVVYHLKK